MPRLIDADALYDIVMNYIKPMTTNEAIILQDFVALLEDAPTVDAKPVVRCKDCRYYQSDGEWYDDDVCKVHPDDDNGYCAWGERKEDAETNSRDRFRTAFLSEAIDYICENEPHTLYIRDLVYKKVITCKDCIRKSGCAIRMMFDFGDDFYCKNGSTNEDE